MGCHGVQRQAVPPGADAVLAVALGEVHVEDLSSHLLPPFPDLPLSLLVAMIGQDWRQERERVVKHV